MSGLSSPDKSESGESTSEAVLCPGAQRGAVNLWEMRLWDWGCHQSYKHLGRNQGVYSLTPPMSSSLTPEK